MTKNKVFTPEEIKEVEELIKTIPRDELLEKYDISTTIFMRIRKAQPELDTAFKRGLKSRKGRTLGGRGRKSTQIYQKEKQPQSSQIELLPSEALAQFQEKIARDKARRLQQELKEIDL